MKNKIIKSLVVFPITFLIAISLVSISKLSVFSNSENTPENQSKIYNFLVNDKRLLGKMSQEMARNDEQKEKNIRNWDIIKKYYEIRLSQNNSNLPEEFRNAWERKIISQLEWVEFANHIRIFKNDSSIQTRAEKEMIEAKMAEGDRIDDEFIRVAESFGIEFDENKNFIEK